MSERTAFDEMVDGRGGVRPHWRGLLGALSGLDAPVLTERVRRLDMAAEEEGAAPAWRCDPVPLPITAREFAGLEAGLSQRARLLEALLQDLYGPQSMLSAGTIPPALVHANPAFLHACSDPHASQQDRMLQFYAADVMRGADGQWRVLADGTGGALGIGYARGTRRLLARVLPELFRSAQVRPLRPFFEAWQEALLRAGGLAGGPAPVVAMLTPGPLDPHWPEHLALSRDLACALVEARDLTVRGGVLSIKTLDGLQAVDLLMRRVPGNSIDPLELATGGSGIAGMGVTGVLDAARCGTVRILNHPGAAVVEAPAFAAFMPALSRRLLGEALLMPTVPTVWLADSGAQRMVAQGFNRWSIRPALDAAAPPAPLHSLSREARAALDRQVAAAPWAFVGSTLLSPSRAPGLRAGGLTPQPVVVRLFLMHDGSSWTAMQGGLGRVLADGEHVTEALPPGATFKDVWVLSEDAGLIRGPKPVEQPRVALRRSAGHLPSRVADDFYWLGRYVERLDAQARLARAALLRRARGAPLPREVAELHVLARCLAWAGLPAGEQGGLIEDQVRGGLSVLGSISQGLDAVARLIEALRDRVTVEMHGLFGHALRAARADVSEAVQARSGRGADVDVLVHAMSGLQRLGTTVAGVSAEGMVRGGGRLFLDLGRRIERAQATASTLAAVLDQPAARIDGMLRLALELCDSMITYQGRYLSILQPAPVLDLVLADAGNPRSLGYQFGQAAALLEAAGDAELAAVASGWERVAVDMADQGGSMDSVPMLLTRLTDAAAGAAVLSERITRRFFALLPRLQAIGLETA